MIAKITRILPSFFLVLISGVAVASILINSCADHGRIVKIEEQEPPVLTVSFKDDVQPILLASCAFNNCHGNFNPQHGVNVTSYAGIMNNDPFHGRHVIPGDANVSALYLAITTRYREIGLQFRMPQFSDTLTSGQQDTIKTWINEGAHDN